MFDIKGKIALVTGANRGIGKSIVEVFLNSGAKKVYAAVRNIESVNPLVKAYGDKVVPLHIDLENPESIKSAAKNCQDVEVVVNNAGVLNAASPLSQEAVESLTFEVKVNVIGLILMAQAFAPILKVNGGGVFVQLNSVASMKCFTDFATYSASKAAAYSITQGLKEQLAKQGTAVISVHPGPIATDMAKKAGLGDIAEPTDVVATTIVEGMKNGDFHLFPDQIARDIGSAYDSFSKSVIES